ncbi:MAG: hypothetical protein ACP5HU_02190 [Phycisphaerae bacterium]
MPEADTDNNVGRRRGWKRRFLLRLLVVIVILAVLVWSLPYLLSTGFGTRLAMRFASGQIRGNMEADDLSLTWRGPVRIRGLHVTDEQGRRVLTADEVEVSSGLWSLLRDSEQFGQVDLRRPRADVYLEPDRPASIIEAFRPVTPPKEPAPPARPHGTVRMHDGSVRIVTADGAGRSFDGISMLLSVNTLDDLEARLEMPLAGGRLEADARVRDLAAGGSVDLLSADAKGTLRTVAPVDLSRLSTQHGLAVPAGVSGLASINGGVTFTDGKGSGDMTVSVDGLSAGSSRVGEIKPIDVVLQSQATWTLEHLSGELNLTQPGTVKLTFEGDPAALSRASVANALLAALSGRSAELGEFVATLNGEMDLAEIGAAVPSLLKLREDVEITAGSVLFEDCELTGGDWPATAGRVHIEATVAGRRNLQCGPVDLRWHGQSREGAEPDVRLRLESPFALASATTVAEGVEAELTRLDLDSLQEKLSGVFDIGDLTLAGLLEGGVVVTIDDAHGEQDIEELSFSGRLEGADVLVVRNGRRFEARTLAADYAGMLSATDDDKPLLHLTSLSLQADDSLSVSGPAMVDFRDGSWSAGPELTARTDLPWLLKLLRDMRVAEETPEITSGRLEWKGQAASTEGVLSADGEGELEGLRFDDTQQPPTEGPIAFAHRATLLEDGEKLRIEHLRVTADDLSMELDGSVEQLSGRAVADITGRYAGNWQRITEIIHRLAPSTRGQLLIRGPAEASFALRGPLRGGEGRTVKAELDAESSVGWASLNAWGLDLLQGNLALTMRDALAQVEGEPIPTAGDGWVRVPLELDLRGEAPVLRLREPADIVESATVTEQTGTQLLSRFNPIFGQLGGLDGQLTLHLDALELPLTEPEIRTGTGRGRLDMSQLNVRPAGILSQILTLAGLSGDRQQSMNVGTVNFTIADGAIHYDDFTVFVGDDLDLKFRGAVGFDDTLDLAVSVPVRAELLRRLGVPIRFVDYARVLEGVRVEIPVAGTRLRPRLDLAEVDVTDLVNRASQLLLLERLQGDEDDEDADEETDKPTRDAPSQLPRTDPQTPGTPRRSDPLLDMLWDVLERPDEETDESDRESDE